MYAILRPVRERVSERERERERENCDSLLPITTIRGVSPAVLISSERDGDKEWCTLREWYTVRDVRWIF